MIHYLITSTRRAGTRYLCSMLQGLKIGNPKEITLYEYLDLNSIEKIYDSGAANNIWAGIIHRCHYNRTLQTLRELSGIKGIDDYTTLFKIFPNIKFIYLHRIDKIAQAVSLEKAIQSEQWCIHHSNKKEQKNVRYNQKRIEQNIKNLYLADSEWSRFYQLNRINPVYITYEELKKDPIPQINKICQLLNIETPQNIETVLNSTALPKRQSNQINREWIERFLKTNPHDQYIPFQNKRR